MSKLFNWAAARLVAAFALALPLAAMAVEYTGTDYEPWSYSAGCVAWRAASGQLFHASTVADVKSDGTIGESYALGSEGHPWNAFARTVNKQPNPNYAAPGLTLIFDASGYNASSDAQFGPLSFGGLWVRALAAENTPYTILDNKSDSTDRTVELGATDKNTYFKFDASFTFDRNSPVTVFGDAIVEIADGATFTINQRAGKGAVVDADASLFLTGEGTLAVVGGLTVNGALDLSGATKPTISGDVTLAGGSMIKLPENTVIDATHPFTVCTGTLSSSGDVVYVKIGGGDPVKALVTVSGGAITAVSTLATYSATIDGDTVFSNIAWEKDGQAATISDMSTAILDISGSGVVTGLASAPAKVTLASGVTLDATSIPAVDFAAIVKSTSGTYRWTANHPLLVPQNYTYEFVGGATDAEQVTISGESYFNNSGNLKTTGYIKFSNFWTGYTTATLDIISGQTVIDASNDKALRGTVTIRASAELVNSKTADALAYGAYTIVNVYGTLTMGSTRWTVGDNNTINMYGGTITGAGQSSNGALDFISGSSLNVNETCEISASVRFRNALIPVTVAADKTLTLSGTIRGYGSNGEIGGVSKRGAGNLTFKSAPNNLPRGIEHKDGHLVFNTQDDVTITNTYNTAATDTRSLWYARQSNWKGTVKVTDLTGNLTWLTGAGNANSTISLQNVDNAYVIAAANSTYAIPGTLSIDGVTVFNNGSSGSTMSISNLTGSSQLVLAGWGGCSSVRYNLLNVDADWAGTLVVSNGITRTQGGTLTIGIGNIESANTNPGACVLPITNVALENATGNVVYNLDNATLNGAAADLEVKSDGIYVAEATVDVTVPVVANTVVTVTVGGETVSPATEGGNVYKVAPGSVVTVTYAAADGYEISGTTEYTVDTASATTFEVAADMVTAQYVAQIRTGATTYEKYTTLAAALGSASAATAPITLLADVTENDITFAASASISGNNHTINANITIANGGRLQLMYAPLNGTLTIQSGGTYVTIGGTLGNVVVQDGGIINLTTLSEDAAPLTVSTLTVNGALTIVSTYGLAESGKTYKAISYVTGNATIAEGASFNGKDEWSASTTVDGDNTVVCLEITKVAVVDGVYYDTAQEAVEAAVASGKQAQFLVQPGTVTLGAGETLVVKGGYQPTVELDAGLSTPPYEVESGYDITTGIYTYAVKSYVAQIGDDKYESIAAAVDAATSGQTVKLLADVTLTAPVTIPAGMTLTLDLGGNTINSQTLVINNRGNLTLANGTISAMSIARNAANGATVVVQSGTYTASYAAFLNADNVSGCAVTINGGTFTAQEAVVMTGKSSNSAITVNGGTLTALDNAVLMDNGTQGYTGNTITVTGGTLNGGITTAGYVACGIYCANDTTVTVTGGTFNITGGCGILARAGKVNVSGTAVINTTGTAIGKVGDSRVVVPCAPIVYDSAANYPGYDETTTAFAVSGGTFTANGEDVDCIVQVADEGDATPIAVSGGTFSNAVAEEFCAEGFEPTDNGNGTYGVRVDKGWIYEDADFPGYTGSWNKEISYDETTHKAAIEDGATYTASKPSAGQFVTINLALSFDGVNDDEDGYEGAKAAIRLGAGDTEGTYVFQLYTTNETGTAAWLNAAASGVTPAVETDYEFTFVLDMTNRTYTATVGGVALTVAGAETLGFASANASDTVQSIEFTGSGKVTSITGSYEDIPVPEGFAEDDTFGDVTLTAAQAEWLNGQGNYDALAAKIEKMDATAFNDAYLLNLDILDTNSDYTFAVKGIVVGEDKVDVTVTLTRTGALTENEKAKPIVGTLKLKGTAALGTGFTVLGETAVEFDANANFGNGATETTVTVDTTATDAKFYLPVIE